MSVLIKGMEMPTDDFIRIILYPNGQAVKANAVDYEEFEAIPVPPHGRLIDADALIKDGWTLRKEVIRMGGYVTHELPLNNPSIPTIIEAEEGEGKDDT